MQSKTKVIQLTFVCTLLVIAISCIKNTLIYNPDTNTICIKNYHKLGFTVELDTPQFQLLPELYECEGKLEPSVSEVINVSLPIQGILKKLLVSPGIYINKGSIIAILENPEIIKMQEEYLIKKSEYAYYREDFKRQGELNLENATSMKIMQQAELNYNKAEASLQLLKKRLRIIGIEADSITSLNIHATILVTAPISGIITKINAVTGMFCAIDNTLCTIINNKNPVLCLQLSGTNTHSLKEDMPVEFYLNSDTLQGYAASITGIVPNEPTNYTTIYATPVKSIKSYQPYTPIKAIIFGDAKKILTVKSDAIINDEKKNFLITEDTLNCFRIIEVTCGRTYNTTTEIIGPLEEVENQRYVSKGEQDLYWLIRQKASDFK